MHKIFVVYNNGFVKPIKLCNTKLMYAVIPGDLIGEFWHNGTDDVSLYKSQKEAEYIKEGFISFYKKEYLVIQIQVLEEKEIK